MPATRRLFLFAAYDPQGVVGEALLWYVSRLSEYGDVVLAMDSDCPESELLKLSDITLHCEAERHREYDFGSYKRCFVWACANLRMETYDFCYLVNDSVYGPLSDIFPSLSGMEGLSVPAFALVLHPDRRTAHLQSWFIGLAPQVFLSDWFRDFVLSVCRLERKEDVCLRYETGFCELLQSRGIPYSGLYSIGGKGIYDRVLSVWRKGIPFVKKSAFVRHGGSAGWQLRQILGLVSPDVRAVILRDAGRLYGREYVDSLLHCSFLQSGARLVSYSLEKSRKKGH